MVASKCHSTWHRCNKRRGHIVNTFDDVGLDLQKLEMLSCLPIPKCPGRSWPREGRMVVSIFSAFTHKKTPLFTASAYESFPSDRVPGAHSGRTPWGPFLQLPLTFPSGLSPAVLTTDAVCQSPARGHWEHLPRCLSQTRYGHRCWHLVTSSPQPDLIALYMSLPKDTSGDIGGWEGTGPGAQTHFHISHWKG